MRIARYVPILVFALGVAACTGTQQVSSPSSTSTPVPSPPLEEPPEDPSIVALVGGEPITLDEFERRYSHSVGSMQAASEDSLAAYKEFLKQYADFRLKVRAAEKAGYAERPSLQKELKSYRSKFARPYLLDREVRDPLIRDLYEKSQQMVDISHLLVRVEPDAAPQDTLEAYRRMQGLIDSLEQGTSFENIAYQYSDDPSARQQPGAPGYLGRLGYVEAGRIVKPFEDAAYSTPVGERSSIFRTDYGYHVLRVHDRIPAVAPIQLSHIMIRPRSNNPSDTLAAYRKVQSLKDSLEAGANFAQLARRYSQDIRTARQGGDLSSRLQGEYLKYTQSFLPAIKKAAFALEKVNDVSDVVRSRYGYHLLKLTGRKEQLSYTEAYLDLKKQIKRLPRMGKAVADFEQRLRRKYDASVDSSLLHRIQKTAPADSLLWQLRAGRLEGFNPDDVFATLGDSTYTLGDLSDYLKANRLPRSSRGRQAPSLFSAADQFLSDQAVSYEAAALEEKDPAFRTAMNDFREGLMLYELMVDSSWTAAAQDTSRLKAYYRTHRGKYRYADRTQVVSFITGSSTLAQSVFDQLESGQAMQTVLESLSSQQKEKVHIDTLKIAEPRGDIYDRALALSEGEHTELLPYKGGRGHMLLINAGQLPARQKTFEEALPQVVSDYRSVLEERMMARLRDTYEIRLFPERLTKAFDDVKAATSTQASAPVR